jgi:hypothetical protein
VAAAVLTMSGCGGDDAGDGDVSGDAHTVEVVRAAFPASQHVGQPSTLVITVRNAGDSTIDDLVVSIDGFERRAAGDVQRPLWIVDDPPRGTQTSTAGAWKSGPLAAGERTTLRWRVTAIGAGRHVLRYAVAGGLRDGGLARLRNGRPARGTFTVRVDDRPASARVDPRTGRVIREESPPNG